MVTCIMKILAKSHYTKIEKNGGIKMYSIIESRKESSKIAAKRARLRNLYRNQQNSKIWQKAVDEGH